MKALRLKYVWCVCVIPVGTLCCRAGRFIKLLPCEPLPAPTSPSNLTGTRGCPWLRYSIAVDDAGNTHFEGVGNPIESGDGDSFSQDFTMTDANRQKIFELAKKLDYFEGNFEAKQKNIAKTGQKTLGYHGRAAADGARPSITPPPTTFLQTPTCRN